ncbi:FecR family protein [Winogradskyella psychrotolerans]|uniref:FecR family protein n=1 Tax=Winogradskyella psychrotolerans TaxID=1344585 RepID=UPI001C078BB2|nr:FecR domain-containing protein [Winogradskyella psychrotolerans]MBU2926668.1 FecR domain-containing protein [Winogradskyella psychrotolerans]
MDKENLLKKWLDNDLSEAEAEAFKALDDAKLYEEIVEEAQRFSGHHQAKVPDFEILDQRLQDKKAVPFNWMRVASSFAAIFIIGLTLFLFWNKDDTNTISTNLAQKETITLPDNSRVELNELSQLDYNSSNWEHERTLNLKGEAFFDVEKGMQFDVNTAFGKVTVLGTEFNVFTKDSIFKVTCYEGLVQVSYNDEIIKLPAGSEFVLESGVAKKSDIVVAEPYWLKKMSVFKDAPIKAVFIELENQYNISVTDSINTNELRFTGAFEHNNLNSALKSITQPFGLTYTIVNNKKVTINNVKN